MFHVPPCGNVACTDVLAGFDVPIMAQTKQTPESDKLRPKIKGLQNCLMNKTAATNGS